MTLHIVVRYFYRSCRYTSAGFTDGLENREEIDDFPTRDRSERKLLAVYADVETAYVKRYSQPTSLIQELIAIRVLFPPAWRKKIELSLVMKKSSRTFYICREKRR